jgi:hypothetical protein
MNAVANAFKHLFINPFFHNKWKSIKKQNIMNTKSSYLPNSDSERVVWLNNFSVKIGTYASTVGVTPAEVTAVHNDSAFYQYIVNMLDSYKQSLNNITSYKNLLKHSAGTEHLGAIPAAPTLSAAPTAVTEGVFDRISKLAQRIKASLNYTESIGNDLGIIAPISTIDLTTLKPDLIIKLDAGRPHIKCAKGVSDGIDLYVDRKDGTGFVLIGRLLKTDFIDTANLPAATPLAEWDYKAMFFIGNDNVGLMSAVESIVVKKM